jgi:hypothetical protein
MYRSNIRDINKKKLMTKQIESLKRCIINKLLEDQNERPPISRKSALGSMGGMYDKKGNPAKQVFGSEKQRAGFKEKFKRNTGGIKKPLPYRLKGKPHPGKAVTNTRGKSVITSRGTGREADVANKNSDLFAKLVANLSKNKNQ